MSLLVVGLSYRTAPVPLLERASVGAAELPTVLHELLRGDHVAEVMVLSTCNRVEVYADVDRFHGGVHDTSSALARRAGVDVPELGEYVYVQYEDAAVAHLFSVAAGVTSILNFAPAVLAVPENVDVRKVDLAVELQILSFHEQRKALGLAAPRFASGLEGFG